MSRNRSSKNPIPFQDRRKGDRRQLIRRVDDRTREQTLIERNRKLHSLLELGQIIGLDLQISEILLKITQKASEVMEADRFNLFTYNANSDELLSAVALGMGEQVIRIPAGVGIAGYCFQTGQTINEENAI